MPAPIGWLRAKSRARMAMRGSSGSKSASAVELGHFAGERIGVGFLRFG
jgi:hypothetical protein